MPEVPDEALSLPPELWALLELRKAGWRITPVITRDQESGAEEVSRVDGMRVHADPFQPEADWVDVIMVQSDTDAKGLRQNPNDETVWLREGSVVDVVAGFLDLPKPGEPNAPCLVISRGEKLWTP